MSLVDVRHQPHAHRQIQRALSRDRVPHAYLFHGPHGVGKETFARGMGQLLLCANPVRAKLDAGDAATFGLPDLLAGCGQCDDCRSVAAGTHPDLHLIYRQLIRQHSDAAVRKRKGLELGVDVIREFLIDKVARTPVRGRAKVFIIREAEVLNIEAQNALLKTLEEPPGATYLILLVASLDELLPTTQSRCQLVRFDALPAGFVTARLKELRPDLSAERLKWYAAFAGGSIGQALEAVDDGLFERSGQLGETIAHSKPRGAGELIKYFTDESKSLGEHYAKRDPDITDTESARRGLKTLFRLTADHYAASLRTQAGPPPLLRGDKGGSPSPGGVAQVQPRQISGHDRVTQVQPHRTGHDSSLEAHAAKINRLALAEKHLDLNANVQLVIETLAHELVDS